MCILADGRTDLTFFITHSFFSLWRGVPTPGVSRGLNKHANGMYPRCLRTHSNASGLILRFQQKPTVVCGASCGGGLRFSDLPPLNTPYGKF